MKTIVSLIGQQPIPNLLPIRQIQPDAALLVYSDFTEKAANRLANLIQDELEVWRLSVDAYAVADIRQAILEQLDEKQAQPEEIIFNITGGTKPMSLAAYLVATRLGSDFVYLQSEGKQSRLYWYIINDEESVLKKNMVLPGLITADDYLRVYVGSYELTEFANDQYGGLFERAIHQVLERAVDEILVGAKLLGALDVDFVVRCDNQVGIIEAKTGGGLKKGLDQLANAGGQQYLGTYTQKFLISDQVWDHTRSNLRELAEARRISVIELPSFSQTGQISDADADKLRSTVCKALGREVTQCSS